MNGDSRERRAEDANSCGSVVHKHMAGAAAQLMGPLASEGPASGLTGKSNPDPTTLSFCMTLSKSLGLYRLLSSNPHTEDNNENLTELL